MAAPQLYPYYGNYGMYGYPGYGYPIQSPVVNYPAAYHPLAAYPNQRIISNGYPMAGTRNLIKFGNFLELNGLFEELATATATVPVSTIKGNFNIQQNGLLDIFSGNDAKFSMYVMSSADLTGKNIIINLATGADCVAAITAGLTVSNIWKYFLCFDV